MVVRKLLCQDQERAKTETRARTKQKRRRPKQDQGGTERRQGQAKGNAKTNVHVSRRISKQSGIAKRVEAQTLLTMKKTINDKRVLCYAKQQRHE